ncbi:MAG: hypothetical protein M3329_04755 [Pseudomonadota bacterium]|nr:hypothetical protein [Pseudomonadota bacterium]
MDAARVEASSLEKTGQAGRERNNRIRLVLCPSLNTPANGLEDPSTWIRHGECVPEAAVDRHDQREPVETGGEDADG